MHKIIVLMLLLAACCGCNNNGSEKIEQTKNPAQKQSGTPSTQMRLIFGQPAQLDSSIYVMIPLELKRDQGSFITKSRGDDNYSWNIIFLNTETQKYHLLDSGRKMLIRSYDIDQAATDVITSHKTGDRLLFYSVTTDDTNKDGKIDNDDAEYLFTSDKEGNNFKQISPPNFDVRSWKVIKETHKILMYAVNMQNGHKRDYEKDEIVPFIYDLKSGAPSHPIFSDHFVDETKTLFDAQWSEKQ